MFLSFVTLLCSSVFSYAFSVLFLCCCLFCNFLLSVYSGSSSCFIFASFLCYLIPCCRLYVQRGINRPWSFRLVSRRNDFGDDDDHKRSEDKPSLELQYEDDGGILRPLQIAERDRGLGRSRREKMTFPCERMCRHARGSRCAWACVGVCTQLILLALRPLRTRDSIASLLRLDVHCGASDRRTRESAALKRAPRILLP
jgi:hypothetical protein